MVRDLVIFFWGWEIFTVATTPKRELSMKAQEKRLYLRLAEAVSFLPSHQTGNEWAITNSSNNQNKRDAGKAHKTAWSEANLAHNKRYE